VRRNPKEKKPKGSRYSNGYKRHPGEKKSNEKRLEVSLRNNDAGSDATATVKVTITKDKHL